MTSTPAHPDEARVRQRAIRQLQTEIVEEMEKLGAPLPAIHFTLTVLLGHNLTWAMVSQRLRQAREKRGRIARQATERPQLKQRCIAAYRAVCAYCDREGGADADPDGKAWELDRITPGRFGGEYEPSNVALACHACNQKKGGNITFCPPPSLREREAA